VTPYAVLLTRTNPTIRTRTQAHIQNGMIGAGIPVLETELNERDAFRAVFSFQQTLDGLNPSEVPNLDKARLNVWEFVHEVVERLKAVEEGSGRERDGNKTSDMAGAARIRESIPLPAWRSRRCSRRRHERKSPFKRKPLSASPRKTTFHQGEPSDLRKSHAESAVSKRPGAIGSSTPRRRQKPSSGSTGWPMTERLRSANCWNWRLMLWRRARADPPVQIQVLFGA
jgi:hypothetical protein